MKTNYTNLFEAYSLIPSCTKEVIDKYLDGLSVKMVLDPFQKDWVFAIAVCGVASACKAYFEKLFETPNANIAYGVNELVYRNIGKLSTLVVDNFVKKEIDTYKGKPLNKKALEDIKEARMLIPIFRAFLEGKNTANEARKLLKQKGGFNSKDEELHNGLVNILNTCTKRPLLVSGKGCEEITQAFAQSIRDKGVDLESGLSKFNQLNKSTSTTQRRVDNSVEVTVKIKNIQNKTVAELSYPQKVSPTSKHSMRLLMWVWEKLAKGYSIKSKTLERMGFNINEIFGVGKIFEDKRQAVEAFREVREFFKRFEWVSVYKATSKKGKEAQISTFGTVKKDRLAILPKKVFNVGHFNDVSIDEAFFIEGIEDEDINYETFMHKVMTAPRAFLVLYSHLEQEIVYNLLNEWDKGGTPKNNFKTITHEKILDWVGFALNNPTRPRRIIDEIVKAIKSINERDKGETFNRLEIKFDETVKQPKKRLKTMRIFYSVNRCEDCLKIEA